MSFVSKFALGMLAANVFCWWELHRRLGPMARLHFWRSANFLFFAVQMAGLTLLLSSRQTHLFDALISKPLLAAVYLWNCLLLPPLAAGFFMLGAAVLILRAAKAFAFRLTARQTAPVLDPQPMTRRRFLAGTLAAAPAAVCLGATGFSMWQIEQFRIRRYAIPLAKLPRELDGLTIAVVSDLHVGRFTEGAVLGRIIEATNALRADLILMPGDSINYALSDLPAALELVRQLRAPHGVFMCVGNHDVIENGERFIEETRAAGVPLLVNESELLQIRGRAVQLLGLRWGGPGTRAFGHYEHGDDAIAASMRELLALRHPDAFPILLAHHPHAFDWADGIPLTLSGHTHGGQLMVTDHLGAGPALFRYWSGLYERAGNALVVSNGVGDWFPLRSRAPAEIVHLTLRAG